MVGRPYNAERDLAAVTRIWTEVGWVDPSEAPQTEALRDFLAAESTLVADIDGSAECSVTRATGSIRHDAADLPLCVIAAVTTSHVGRRQHLASALVAETLAEGAADGAAVAALGMFEQGFYDRFGFGTSGYQHSLTFDPAMLDVPIPDRPPVRLGLEDSAEMHALMVRRHRGHGSVVLDQPAALSCEYRWTDKPWALGYRADDGRLTHFVLGSTDTGNGSHHGPFTVDWLGFEEPGQLLELLGLLRSVGDQVRSITVQAEPAEIQLQDLLRLPIRHRHPVGAGGGSVAAHHALAEQQIRIMDLRVCVEAVHFDSRPLTFGLKLHDPLETLADAPWRGVGGEYTVVLGEKSSVNAGLDAGAPVLEASVNAFSRLWMGCRPASSLALTDRLVAPAPLLDALDRTVRLPTPVAGWVL